MLRRLWFLLTRGQRQRELDDEMRLHLELREAANQRRGMDGAEAARMARVRFGNPLRVREESLDAWRLAGLEDVGRDVRHAIRRLHQQPGRALVIVLTLALGIGATTAMFSLIDAMLLKPAPWDTTGRLAWIVGLNSGSLSPRSVAYTDYLAYHDRATALAGLAAEGGMAMAIGTKEPQRLLGGVVSGNYFEVLGIHAEVGRPLTAADDAAVGANPVVVLSHPLWMDQFGGRPGVIGERLTINGHPFTIVGVAPRGFTGVAFAADPYQLWIPMAMYPVVMPQSAGFGTTANQQRPRVRVVGRLTEGASLGAADAELRVIAHDLDAPDTPADKQRRIRVLPLRGGLTPWEQAALAPMFELVAIVPLFVLLVACANVANVLVAHHQARRREFAMRRAIGASRARLVRQLLAESFVLALGAAFAGAGAASVLTRLIVFLGEVPIDVSTVVTPDIRALLAATVTGVGAIAMFGLAPAITATRVDVLPILKDEGTTATVSGGPVRLRRALVVTQVALSLGLLIMAGLFLKSLSRTLRVDPGFDPRGLAIASVDPGLLQYTPERRADFTRGFLERASGLAGVTYVAAADVLPLGGVRYVATLRSENGTSSSCSLVQVSSTYFDTLALPIVRGRTFTTAETVTNVAVAIISASAARRLWPGQDPLGQIVRTDDPKQPPRQVIGVVRDSTWLSLDEAPSGTLYLPLPPASAAVFVVRSKGDPTQTLASLKDIARGLDADLPVTQGQTMAERIHRSVNLRRALVALLGVLGGVTLLLAAVGIYGVAAYGASVRTREVGIRMALGARAADVLRLIVRENLRLSCFGIAIGLVLSATGATVLSSFLFGLTPRDDVSVVLGAAFLLCGVAAVASYMPARRAASLDPLRALRHE
ncbi:MAG TPA: ABC transporter permease [Vicinamibacterales bacterium]|jgi:predicted permease|nr:ABC transporter permease [Vicinamibacterales bacterium]